MGKQKISAKRASSSRTSKNKAFDLNAFQGISLKRGVKLQEHDPSRRLKDVNLVRAALFEALGDGDTEAFKEILRAHLESINKEALAARSGVSRTTMFRMLEPDANPTLNNVAKVLSALKAG